MSDDYDASENAVEIVPANHFTLAFLVLDEAWFAHHIAEVEIIGYYDDWRDVSAAHVALPFEI